MARRWPGPCLALVLLTFTSQSLATTLDWCLHGDDGAHVASGLVPCDGHGAARVDARAVDARAVDARAVDASTADATRLDAEAANTPSAAPASLPCHGAAAGGAAHSVHHVAASSDGASSPASAVPAPALVAHWHFLPRVLALEFVDVPDNAPSRQDPRPDAARPSLSGAVPGESSRLLI